MKNNAPSKPVGEQPSPPAAEFFLTKNEVAQRLRKTPRTIEHWTRAGLLPVIRISRSCFYDWGQIQSAIRENFTVNAKGAK